MSHADYALVPVFEHLGADADALNAEWADFAGDESTVRTFEVATETPTDAYVEIQAYDVGSFGHDILINGESLTGFDIPPSRGWQLWMDAVTGASLHGGENTLRVVHGTERDEFAVGNVVVHWRDGSE